MWAAPAAARAGLVFAPGSKDAAAGPLSPASGEPPGVPFLLTGGPFPPHRRSPRCPHGCVWALGGSRVLFPPPCYRGLRGCLAPSSPLTEPGAVLCPSRSRGSAASPGAVRASRGTALGSMCSRWHGIRRRFPWDGAWGSRSPGEVGTAPAGAGGHPGPGIRAAAEGIPPRGGSGAPNAAPLMWFGQRRVLGVPERAPTCSWCDSGAGMMREALPGCHGSTGSTQNLLHMHHLHNWLLQTPVTHVENQPSSFLFAAVGSALFHQHFPAFSTKLIPCLDFI